MLWYSLLISRLPFKKECGMCTEAGLLYLKGIFCFSGNEDCRRCAKDILSKVIVMMSLGLARGSNKQWIQSAESEQTVVF